MSWMRRRKVRFRRDGDAHVLTCPDCDREVRSDSRGKAVMKMKDHGRDKHRWSHVEDVW